MPKISVIIPVYNAERYLGRCLDSVRRQNFQDLEIICIDDGGTDSGGVMLDKYAAADSRFVVVHKKNAGVSAARNDGINMAHGEYIHFLDADDFVDSGYYKKMYDAVRKYNPDVVCSGFVTNTKYARNLRYQKDFVKTGLYDKLFNTCALTDGYVWRYLFRRQFIIDNNLHFDTNMISQEDAMFVLDALRLSGAVAFVAGTYYHYMFNSESALNRHDAEHHAKLKQQYKIGKEYRREFARKNGMMRLWRWRKLLRKFRGML